MAFCVTCGHELTGGDRFCPACGRDISAIPPSVTPRRSSLTPGQWIGGAVVGALVAFPIGGCNFLLVGAASNSLTLGAVVWGATFLIAFLMAAGMLKQQADKRELMQRQLEDLRKRQS